METVMIIAAAAIVPFSLTFTASFLMSNYLLRKSRER